MLEINNKTKYSPQRSSKLIIQKSGLLPTYRTTIHSQMKLIGDPSNQFSATDVIDPNTESTKPRNESLSKKRKTHDSRKNYIQQNKEQMRLMSLLNSKPT